MQTKSYAQQQAELPLEVVSNSQGEMVEKKCFSEIQFLD